MRSLNPENLTNVERAARLVYLNKTCFNGLYRVNSKGQFNVPIGSYKNPDIVSENKIRESSKLLKDVCIIKAPFTRIGKIAKPRDFIYFDPPYYPISKTSSFTSYTQENFMGREQKQLASLFERLNKKRCLLMLSNSNSDFIVSLYKKFKINLVDAKRIINCDKSKRGFIKEIVVTNY